MDTKDPTPQEMEKLQHIINRQAEDDGLWFIAQTAPESYLQRELRILHDAIESSDIVNLFRSLQKHSQELEEENRRMREALEWHRDECQCDENCTCLGCKALNSLPPKV